MPKPTDLIVDPIGDICATSVERDIVKMAVKGTSSAQIAHRLQVPEAEIVRYLRRPEVREYLQELREIANEMDQSRLASILRESIDKRVADAEDMGAISKKDTLDLIRVYADLINNINKGKKEAEEDNVLIQIYNQVT